MASDGAERDARGRGVRLQARGPARVVRITRPVESTVVLDRSPYLESAEARGARCVLLLDRRNARFFVGDGGGLEETDRVEDDVHSQHDQGGWSQARYQRGVEEGRHLVHVAEVAFGAYKERGFDRLLVGARTSWSATSSRSSTRTCASGSSPRRTSTSRTPGRGRARRGECCDRGLAAASSARRSTGWPRASGAADAARRAWRPCCKRSTSSWTLLVGETFRSAAMRPGPGCTTGDGPGDQARALREHRRAGDREGDRAVGARDQGALPRRSRPARRDRRGAALLMPAPERLLNTLRRYVSDERVLAAIAEVPRDRFVPPDLRAEAWENIPLPIGSARRSRSRSWWRACASCSS